MGLISACLPTLRPILTFVLRRVGFSKDSSAGADKLGRPSPLITFGQGNARQKINDYTTTRSIGNDSLEQLSGGSEVHDGHPTTTFVVVQENLELNKYGANQSQPIASRTNMSWHESHVHQGMGGKVAHMT